MDVLLAVVGELCLARQVAPEKAVCVLDGAALPRRVGVTPGSLDAVVLLDVLEHVDDEAALTEVRDVLRDDGLALISVPAFPRVWSYRDQDAGHQRRYTRPELTELLIGKGFRVLQVCYYQCLLFPVLFLSRWLGRRGPGWRNFEEQRLPILNSALAWVNRWEARLGARVRLPWGSSLVAVCRKHK